MNSLFRDVCGGFLPAAASLPSIADAGRAAEPEQVLQIPMQAHEHSFREHGLKLEQGRRLANSLQTPHPAGFNLHHRSGADTTFADRRRAAHRHAHSLSVPASGVYCFMRKNAATHSEAYGLALKYQLTAG